MSVSYCAVQRNTWKVYSQWRRVFGDSIELTVMTKVMWNYQAKSNCASKETLENYTQLRRVSLFLKFCNWHFQKELKKSCLLHRLNDCFTTLERWLKAVSFFFQKEFKKFLWHYRTNDYEKSYTGLPSLMVLRNQGNAWKIHAVKCLKDGVCVL